MTDTAYDEAMALARQMARERNRRYAELLASEREADVLRKGLADIINADPVDLALDPAWAQRVASEARDAAYRARAKFDPSVDVSPEGDCPDCDGVVEHTGACGERRRTMSRKEPSQ